MRPCKDITPNIPVNAKIAESQDEYQTLHAHYVQGPHGVICFAVELDDKEIEQLKQDKRLYINVLTFNNPMQPLLITADPRVVEEIVEHYTKEAIKV